MMETLLPNKFLNAHQKRLGLGTETRYQYGTGTYVTGMY